MDHPFADRQAAGQQLAQRLGHLAGQADTVVLGLPRGGLPVAAEVALALGAPLEVVLVRKIGAPMNPELALGAVAGSQGQVLILNDALMAQLGLTRSTVDRLATQARAELARRALLWGAGSTSDSLRGKQVILVDDGIATGATMQAALAALRQAAPARIILAVPIAGRDSLLALAKAADEVICLQSPASFGAVGAHYVQFPQVSDEEVSAILATARKRAALPTGPR